MSEARQMPQPSALPGSGPGLSAAEAVEERTKRATGSGFAEVRAARDKDSMTG